MRLSEHESEQEAVMQTPSHTVRWRSWSILHCGLSQWFMQCSSGSG